MVVKGYHPFSLVEDEEFKIFVLLLSSGYHLPTRKTLSTSLIPTIYLSVREKVKLNIYEAFAICMTTDIWTSINNEGCVAVTVHFVDSVSKLSTFLLGCISFNERHTAENLNAQLRIIAEEQDTDNKIVVVVRQCSKHSLYSQTKQLATPNVFCTYSKPHCAIVYADN
ncbi:hypothetical protein PR048_018097 [Dryococelus australis]|uniref:Uncharacterized protein n=1 Tax=Dryococelus australis TaxID=614101 RepID=A0ABQ9HBB7_9NEOP|nr:hypothetical protein PR048_018097 [Dryococelus australis]